MSVVNEFKIKPAKYANNMVAVHCPSTDGFKTRAARLADALANGRYSHREHSYIMSKRKAEKFLKMYLDGWDAGTVTGKINRT